ncbi:MAG: hypothetical protein EPN14_09965 [Gallionella sp.]|nr:MAG: hypothetical protein EPN14_09965 [Gallionella sp.]
MAVEKPAGKKPAPARVASAGSTKKPAARAKTKTASGGKTGSDAREKTARGKTGKKTGAKPDGLAAGAVRIVEQAASILEEEISAGIVAAKKVGERYTNASALRSGENEQVIQRFRKDAHEVLDILLDLVNLSISAIGGLGERAMNIRGTGVSNDKAHPRPEENLPELIVPATLKAGESGKVGMLVENGSGNATAQFGFTTAGLLNTSGDRLDAQHISFDPPLLAISANDVEKVNVTVAIPEGTPPGQYSGLLQAPAIQMRAILTVQVEA